MPSPLPPAEIKYELAHIHDNRGSAIVASSIICIILASIAVFLRLLARRLSKAKILADDYMMVFALVICMGQVAACLYSVHLGAGKHIVLLKDLPAYAKTIISMEVLYCIGTSAFKYSALLLFHRIFGIVPRFTMFLWCLAFVILANNMIAEVFLSIFQCTPLHKAWDTEVEGSCVKPLLAATIPAAINAASDVVTVLLPLPLIWNLQMERNRKIQLVGIFLLSGFVCIASIYRTVIVNRLTHGDATWADVDPIIWAVVENAIGIVSASLLTMRPIYSIIVRGHNCTAATHSSCERCSRSTGNTSNSAGRTAVQQQHHQKPPGSAKSWADAGGEGKGLRDGSFHSHNGSLEKGGGAATEAMEMY